MTRKGTGAALLLFFFVALAGCGGSQARVKQASADSTLYVDVRRPQEFAEAHVRGAVHIPYDQMKERWRELEPYRDRRMVVYCRTGRRAAVALEVLKANGFTRAENGGGLEDLATRGVPVLRSAESPGN